MTFSVSETPHVSAGTEASNRSHGEGQKQGRKSRCNDSLSTALHVKQEKNSDVKFVAAFSRDLNGLKFLSLDIRVSNYHGLSFSCIFTLCKETYACCNTSHMIYIYN